jgi:hypothetical protein
MKPSLLNAGSYIQRAGYFGTAFIIAASTLLILTLAGNAQAAQITKRALYISSAKPSATSVTYTIGASTGGSDTTNGFFFATTHVVKALKLQACTTAVGTCSGTAGTTIPDFTSAGGYTLTGWQDATAFTRDSSNTNDCDGTAQTTTICLSRSSASSSEDTTHSHKIVLTGIANPSTANTTFFIRMTTYTNATYTGGTITDTGTVASAVTQTLTVNAAVAEVLNFCVGSTTVDDDTTTVGANCGAIGGTSVNLGTLDTTGVAVSPVSSSTNTGNDRNGVAMLRTNAANGSVVSYDAIQQSGTNHVGTLRVNGASCNATDTDLTDQCIRAQGSTQGTFTAGTERFGMTIAGTNCANATSVYTCSYGSGTEHLVPSSNYVGKTGSFCATNACNASGNGFAWVDTGASTQIASSSSVVADEALVLKFAATPSITTPFGAYAAQTDFIAVPTY